MLTRLTATEIAAKLRAREISAREVAEAFLSRIEARDTDLNSFITVAREEALVAADAAQARLDAGEGGPLCGVPVAVKDNISTRGIRTTCASRILGDYIPPYDATVIERLQRNGVVLLGKTNLDEFAMGASTETGCFGPAKNPWDIARSPGGSSGGSAAAVAGDLAPLSLGSDTGGSIRQPASLCGVVGFKPTYGRVSRYGLVAFGSSLDQIGPLGKTVEDVALLAETISGHCDRDSTSLNLGPIQSAQLKTGKLKGLKVGLPKELFSEALNAGVLDCVFRALELLRKEGVETVEISLPAIKFGVTTYYIIAPAEASSNLARFDGIRYGIQEEGSGHIGVVEKSRAKGFGHEVKSRIMIGTYALSAGYYDAYYLRAQQVRALMQREFEQAYHDVDFIVSPTSPVTAFKVGELLDDPLALKLLDYCTIPANMGGMPGISLNCGLHEGLPVGLQWLAPACEDERLLQAAWACEQVLGASPRPPFE